MLGAAPPNRDTAETSTRFAWRYRYFYFRIFRWLEAQNKGTVHPHIVAGFLLSLLTLLQFQFAAVLIDGVFGTSLILNASTNQIVWEMLGLNILFFAITHFLLIRDGKWQKVLREFSALTDNQAAAADRWFKVFVAGSMSLLPLGAIIAAAIGPRP